MQAMLSGGLNRRMPLILPSRYGIYCVLYLMTLFHSFPALAADEVDEYDTLPVELGPMVVTATRTERLLSEVPASVSVVDHKQYEEQQSQAVSTVLKQLPGVDFGGGARPGGQIPIIRGASGKQITLMVDGARRNEANSILSPLLVDPDMVAITEVVRGPSSSLYGNGGLGGIMAFRTLSADDLLDPGETFGSQVFGRYATANEGQNYHAKLYGRADGFDGLVAFGYRSWDSIRQGGGEKLAPNDGNQRSGLAKMGWQTDDDKFRVEATYQIYDQDNLRPNNPQAGSNFPFIQRHHTRQEQTTLHMTTRDDQHREAFHGTFYWSALTRDAYPDLSATPPLDAIFSKTETIGTNLQNTSRLDFSNFGYHQLTYGVDFYQDEQSAATGGSPNPVIPDGEQQVVGIFLQDEVKFGYGWSLIPGIRWDYYQTSVNDGSTPERNDSRPSPKIALQWQALSWLSLYGSYGQAFRAPSISEMYQNLSGPTFFTNFIPNPDLNPEVGKTGEFGFRIDYQPYFEEQDRAYLWASFYDMHIDDLIQSKIVGFFNNPFLGPRPVLQYQNVSRARRRGVELTTGYQTQRWGVDLIYAAMRTKDLNTGEKLFSPPDKLVGKFRYDWQAADLSLLWISTWVAAQNYDSTVLRRRDGYDLHDIFLVWQPVKNLQIDLGLTNIFDKGYAPYYSENSFTKVEEEGRSFKATVALQF